MYSERLPTQFSNILSYQGFHLFILRTLESREKKSNMCEAAVLSRSSLTPSYTIPCAVNIAHSEMLSSRGMVPTLKVTTLPSWCDNAKENRNHPKEVSRNTSADMELTLELALASSLRSLRFLNISRFSCWDVASCTPPKKTPDLYIPLNITKEESSLVFLLCDLGHGVQAKKREAHAKGLLHHPSVF